MADGVVPVTSRQTFDETPGSESSPIPVFVLGLQRSGTTWIANMLGAHSQVACVEAEDHHGIHESIFFSHFARTYGDLEDDENFRRFATDFTASDYYLLTGIEETWFWQRRPRSYAGAFRDLMEEMARRRDARFWIEKSPDHTLLCRQLARDFPDARFVCVVRESMSRVRSMVSGPKWRPRSYLGRILFLFRACAANDLYGRTLKRFSSECGRGILIRYEDLLGDADGNLRRITDFVGMPFEPTMLRARFAPNSSFRSSQERDRALSAFDRGLIRVFAGIFHFVPLPLLRGINSWRHRGHLPKWPAWVWKRRIRRPSDAGWLRPAH
jgi:hypothetical protein